MRVWVLAVLSLILTMPSHAQSCPRAEPTGSLTSSAVQTLHGKLLFHDDLRQWFELKLDHPVCGQQSVQLVRWKGNSKALETLRGCDVRSTGALDIAGTGYFSLDMYQDVRALKPITACVRKPPFPDYSYLHPAHDLSHYRVEMDIHYGRGDQPFVFTVTSDGRALKPWQAYASYWLTGLFSLYGDCAKGFSVKDVFGTPQAEPLLIDDATFQPESAAAAGVHDLKLGYTCVRDR